MGPDQRPIFWQNWIYIFSKTPDQTEPIGPFQGHLKGDVTLYSTYKCELSKSLKALKR